MIEKLRTLGSAVKRMALATLALVAVAALEAKAQSDSTLFQGMIDESVQSIGWAKVSVVEVLVSLVGVALVFMLYRIIKRALGR